METILSFNEWIKTDAYLADVNSYFEIDTTHRRREIKTPFGAKAKICVDEYSMTEEFVLTRTDYRLFDIKEMEGGDFEMLIEKHNGTKAYCENYGYGKISPSFKDLKDCYKFLVEYYKTTNKI